MIETVSREFVDRIRNQVKATETSQISANLLTIQTVRDDIRETGGNIILTDIELAQTCELFIGYSGMITHRMIDSIGYPVFSVLSPCIIPFCVIGSPHCRREYFIFWSNLQSESELGEVSVFRRYDMRP